MAGEINTRVNSLLQRVSQKEKRVQESQGSERSSLSLTDFSRISPPLITPSTPQSGISRIKQDRGIDLVFLGDTTGSMTSYLEAQHAFMQDTIQRVNDIVPNPSFGFVFYQSHDPDS